MGYADLTLGNRLDDVLAAHIDAGNGRFRGVRQIGKWDADPNINGSVSAGQQNLYLNSDFQQGLVKLSKLGLIFEASVYHTQIDDVTALATAVPDAQIVLVHTGSPLGRGRYADHPDAVQSDWLTSMRQLAKCSNVTVMLGGMLMSLANFDFLQATRPPTSEELANLWSPFITPAIELFGPDRCIVASNFPVEKAGVPYRTIWNTFKRLTADYSNDEKRHIFSETARRKFRL